jgi:hypothetical protein
LGRFADFSYVRHLFSPDNFHSTDNVNRDALKERPEIRQCAASDVAPRPEFGAVKPSMHAPQRKAPALGWG